MKSVDLHPQAHIFFFKKEVATPLYRMKKGNDVWHWCKNCPEYPRDDYEIEYCPYPERPTIGELCQECKAREKVGTCQ